MRFAHACQSIGLSVLLLCTPTVAAPQRVVSTFLCTDEYVFRLLPRERIAALDYLAADTHPVVSTIADKVKDIALIHPSTETVLVLKPDLVVLYQGTLPRLREHLIEAGVPIVEIPWATTLAQIREVTRTLGARLGASPRAEAMIAEMDHVLAKARADAPRPAASALIYEPNGYATGGGITDEIMVQAGLSDVEASLGPTRSGTIPIEAVVADAPELLILNGTRGAASSRADLVMRHPALVALRDRTLITRAALTPLLCPGPWSASAATIFSELGNRARALALRKLSP
jgi:iron complex transport system substrate-binding protein